jgi:hypothetical protein
MKRPYSASGMTTRAALIIVAALAVADDGVPAVQGQSSAPGLLRRRH